MLLRAIQALNATIIPGEKILSEKSVEFGIHLKWRTTGYKQKAEIIFATRTRTCWKYDPYTLFLQKEKREWKLICK